ncbi:uncharacterized protein LOC134278324, partial [Saccostrea cucullata]|uniref:uncharacterized protein LOC134278324 n=1 Tax=Saccostrea cuccullata TaxID=36930 RepID=UPI002ED394E8
MKYEYSIVSVALMCYSYQIVGHNIVIDAYRAKDSSTTYCKCRLTSDKPSTLNLTNYNGVHPGIGCGSTVMVLAGGTSMSMNCFVTGRQLPINGSDVDILIENPQLASDTRYCLSIESADLSAVLSVSCDGDLLPSTTRKTSYTSTTEEINTATPLFTTDKVRDYSSCSSQAMNAKIQ